MGTPLITVKRHFLFSTGDASTGTWTRVTNSGNPYITKSAAAATSKISTVLPIESRANEYGALVTGIDLLVNVATANLVSTPVVTVYRRNLSKATTAAAANLTASTLTGTTTGATVTASATDRLITWVNSGTTLDYSTDSKAAYVVELKMNMATTTATKLYGGIVYFQIAV